MSGASASLLIVSMSTGVEFQLPAFKRSLVSDITWSPSPSSSAVRTVTGLEGSSLDICEYTNCERGNWELDCAFDIELDIELDIEPDCELGNWAVSLWGTMESC